jgi:nucleoside-diphosphate-sugar epimerase
VDDVVDQLLLQADRPEAVGQAFFSAARETRTVEALMRSIADVLGVKARTVYVPPMLLRAVGSVADVISNATGKKLPINRKLARQLLAPGWECSTEKAERLLGFVAKRSLESSIRRSAESYLAAGWL